MLVFILELLPNIKKGNKILTFGYTTQLTVNNIKTYGFV